MKKLLLVGLLMLAGSAWAFQDCDECPEMVVIPAGSFMMGSDFKPDPFINGEERKYDQSGEISEKPKHRVSIRSFAIGRYEITQEQFYSVMGFNPSVDKSRTLPVHGVSWLAAQLFTQKLSQKTGKKYRLPSEAEWEYAARGGTTTRYPWGDTRDDPQEKFYAWSARGEVHAGLHNGGLKEPNQFGLHDMIGNALEWTQDCWNPSYSGAPTDGSAWTSGDCSRRVLRGNIGSDWGRDLRSSLRNQFPGTFPVNDAGGNNYGFRVARTP